MEPLAVPPSAGTELPPWEVPELTRTHFVRYAGASGDFNPIHHDEVMAQRLGYASVFGQGMLTAGILAHYVTDVVGVGALRRFRVRFTGQVWPGDVLTCRGSVALTRDDPDGDDGLVELELEVVNGTGDVVVSGAATAAVRPT